MESISKELRQAVLQAAIQGKLTKQLPEDGNARDLLKQIKNEKERLIKEKKIKKEKALESITEDEIPFDIPDNWNWCRLPDIAISELGKTLNGSKDVGLNKPYLCSINVYWNGIDLQKVKTAKFSEQDIKKYLLCKGDLLICEGGDVGRTAIWEFDDEMYYQNALHRVRFYCGVSAYYFRYLMIYYKSIGLLDDVSKGMTIKHLVQGSLYKLPIPLPPLAEQKRIVARVEELMVKIDELEKVETELRALHQAFPNDMKAALLQAAMQGKLTEQLQEDGNAMKLIEQIKSEKERLIKEGKIKKEKELAPITEDEISFDVPDNWEWCRLGTILKISTGNKDANYGTKDGKYPFFTCSKEPIKSPNFSFEGECLLLPGNGANIGLVLYYNGKFEAYQRTYVLEKLLKITDMRYLQYALIWNWKKYNNIGKMYGSAIPFIKLSNLKNYIFPLPPLAEQKRIVEKLDRLLPLCDSLQTEL